VFFLIFAVKVVGKIKAAKEKLFKYLSVKGKYVSLTKKAAYKFLTALKPHN